MKKISILLFICLNIVLLLSCSNTNKNIYIGPYTGKEIQSIEYISTDYNGGFTYNRKIDFESNGLYGRDYFPHENENTPFELITELDPLYYEEFINKIYNYGLLNLKEKYLNRHKLMKEVFEKQGFKNEIPKAGIYQCFNIPKSCNGVEFEDNEEFCYWLFKNTNIMILPINKGEKTIAASVELLVNDENGEKELFRKIEEELNKYNFEF